MSLNYYNENKTDRISTKELLRFVGTQSGGGGEVCFAVQGPQHRGGDSAGRKGVYTYKVTNLEDIFIGKFIILK